MPPLSFVKTSAKKKKKKKEQTFNNMLVCKAYTLASFLISQEKLVFKAQFNKMVGIKSPFSSFKPMEHLDK